MKLWIARAAALVALVAAVAAVYLAVTTVSESKEVTTTQSQDLMLQLAQANGALGDKLDALKPGDSPADAQDATRNLAELARDLDGRVDGGGNLADGLHAVFRAQLDYLDAVGSTLNNPRSALRGRIGELAQALRDALQQVPGGDHRAIRGGRNLVVFSEARAGV